MALACPTRLVTLHVLVHAIAQKKYKDWDQGLHPTNLQSFRMYIVLCARGVRIRSLKHANQRQKRSTHILTVYLPSFLNSPDNYPDVAHLWYGYPKQLSYLYQLGYVYSCAYYKIREE